MPVVKDSLINALVMPAQYGDLLFAGKFLSAYAVCALLLTVYYVVIAILSMSLCGDVTGRLATSFGLALLYLFAAIGVCNLIGCLAPSGSVSLVVSLVLLVVVQLFIVNVGFDSEPWFSLSYSASSVSDCILGIQTVFDGSMNTTDYQPLLSTATMTRPPWSRVFLMSVMAPS